MARKQYQITYKDGKTMIYVGIDIAKETHVVAAVDSDGVIIIEPFSFSNNHEGFKFLKSKLDSLDKNNILIGLESTAHYAENVIFFLHSFGSILLLSTLFKPLL